MIPPPSHWHGAVMVALIQFGLPWSANAQPVTLRGETMGTTYRVTVPTLRGSGTSLKVRVDALLLGINAQMSTYQADSELSRLNANANRDWLMVSAELFTVLKAAQAVSAATDGAFDITVGPLVNLWGFGPQVQRAAPPAVEALAAARARVGYRQLELADGPPRVRKARADLLLDLSAIAKGYAVDQVAALVESAGLHDYLVDIGGEMRARGRNAQGAPWQVGVASPVANQDEAERVFSLTDSGLATSGDYRNFFDYHGRRYSHEIDPATGEPLQNDVASVTVLHPSCMLADAYATALMVMGAPRGVALASRLHFQALFLVRNAGGFAPHATPNFPASR